MHNAKQSNASGLDGAIAELVCLVDLCVGQANCKRSVVGLLVSRTGGQSSAALAVDDVPEVVGLPLAMFFFVALEGQLLVVVLGPHVADISGCGELDLLLPDIARDSRSQIPSLAPALRDPGLLAKQLAATAAGALVGARIPLQALGAAIPGYAIVLHPYLLPANTNAHATNVLHRLKPPAM
eukprot:11072307-Alexandrium_andersonii.AAC.2